MDPYKESFLRNEFLTMSVLGALGRSKTYSESATKDAKTLCRDGLRKELDEISQRYRFSVKEQEHLSNIKELSDRLSEQFSDCLRAGRFRIGIAQKALNLYLKYLWCIDLIPIPPHCPFDSIIIAYLPDCGRLSWTSIDTIEDYEELIDAARKKADGKPLAQWELEIWTNSVQSAREPANSNDRTPRERAGKMSGPMKGWTTTATRFHDDLRHAMKPYQGRNLETSEINDIVKHNPILSHNAQFIQPPDHCINHTNSGACACALTDTAIFEQVRRGLYHVRSLA